MFCMFRWYADMLFFCCPFEFLKNLCENNGQLVYLGEKGEF